MKKLLIKIFHNRRLTVILDMNEDEGHWFERLPALSGCGTTGTSNIFKMMYSPDKMMGSKGLHGTPISAPGCFPSGRYSPPSYRTAPDQMPPPPPPRRCMPNPP
ncbi:hypothetical protein PV326_006835, partial [Microctonus aethiopoides]